jgi:hypothetical protein
MNPPGGRLRDVLLDVEEPIGKTGIIERDVALEGPIDGQSRHADPKQPVVSYSETEDRVVEFFDKVGVYRNRTALTKILCTRLFRMKYCATG